MKKLRKARKPTVSEKRKDALAQIAYLARVSRTDIGIFEEEFVKLKRFPSMNTGENRRYYRDKLRDVHVMTSKLLVQYDLLCELCDIVGDTKEKAW